MHLLDQRDALGQARLLFVRKPERRAESGRRVILGRSRPGEERLLELDVEHQEDLRELDFAAVLAAEASPGAVVEGPLFVVCTHGKRDRCCARYGRPLYDALRDRADTDRVWQSSHVGGDRFAGNVVVLPHGLYYGRAGPGDVDGILTATAAGRVVLEHYRGRSAYSFEVQAAEQRIREYTGLVGIGDLVFLDSERVRSERSGDEITKVRFRASGSAVHEVDIVATLAHEPAYLTCGSAALRRAPRYVEWGARVISA
jgi:hypothetical protein